jgi:hypothetical protein
MDRFTIEKQTWGELPRRQGRTNWVAHASVLRVGLLISLFPTFSADQIDCHGEGGAAPAVEFAECASL